MAYAPEPEARPLRRRPHSVRWDDLTEPQRRLVLALVRLSEAARERREAAERNAA